MCFTLKAKCVYKNIQIRRSCLFSGAVTFRIYVIRLDMPADGASDTQPHSCYFIYKKKIIFPEASTQKDHRSGFHESKKGSRSRPSQRTDVFLGLGAPFRFACVSANVNATNDAARARAPVQKPNAASRRRGARRARDLRAHKSFNLSHRSIRRRNKHVHDTMTSHTQNIRAGGRRVRRHTEISRQYRRRRRRLLHHRRRRRPRIYWIRALATGIYRGDSSNRFRHAENARHCLPGRVRARARSVFILSLLLPPFFLRLFCVKLSRQLIPTSEGGGGRGEAGWFTPTTSRFSVPP